MRALTFNPPASRSGVPELQLVDLPVPSAKKGEVLVRVHYAGLNNFDLETSRGDRNRAIVRARKRSTVVSGIEMAGVAEGDGETIRKGDEVVAYTNIFKGPFFHAEHVALPEIKMARVPKNVSIEGAASIVGGALTSIAALERIAGLRAESTVLITGATGSVGVTGVQLATHLGAELSAVCHSTQTAFVLSQGASRAYAYDHNEMPEAENQFDLVFDTAPSLSYSRARKYLKPQGTFISTMPHLDLLGFARSRFSRRKCGFLMEADTDATRMERLRTLMAQSAFSSVVDSVHPYAMARDAFDRQQQSGKRGKILIDFS